MQTTATIAKYICSASLSDFDPAVVHRAKLLCLSSLGAAIWGSRLRAGAILAAYAKESEAAEKASVIGCGFKTSAELAALVNGTASHAPELEDVAQPGAMYTCQIIPAVFALGESLNASGNAILEALIAGYEVQSRMAMHCAHGRGWLNPPHIGSIGVAASAAKLLGFDVAKTTNALSLAASLASGLLNQTGSEAHLVESGAAGWHGLTAAMLARLGLAGSPTILEGPGGYWDALSGRPELAFMLGTGGDLRIMDVNMKKYPCCGVMQRVIDGVIALVDEHRISPDDVAEVEVHVNTMFDKIIKYPSPTTGTQSQFSLRHAIAASLLKEQEYLFDAFTDEKVADPRYRELWPLVKSVTRPEFDPGIMEGDNPISITLTNGTRYERVCYSARGDATDPLTDEELIRRYNWCVESRLSPEAAKQSALLILALDQQSDVSALMRILAFPDRA